MIRNWIFGLLGAWINGTIANQRGIYLSMVAIHELRCHRKYRIVRNFPIDGRTIHHKRPVLIEDLKNEKLNFLAISPPFSRYRRFNRSIFDKFLSS